MFISDTPQATDTWLTIQNPSWISPIISEWNFQFWVIVGSLLCAQSCNLSDFFKLMTHVFPQASAEKCWYTITFYLANISALQLRPLKLLLGRLYNDYYFVLSCCLFLFICSLQ